MKTIKWIDRNFEPLMMAITFFMVCGLIFLQVVLRFIFKSGFSWGEEISRFLFVWSVFLTVPFITKNNKHVSVAIIRDLLPETVGKILAVLVDTAIVCTAVLLFASSIKNVQMTMAYNDRATSINISMNWLFMAPVIGYLLMALRGVQGIIWKVRHFQCSYTLFINPSGLYSDMWDIVIAQGRCREELKGAYDQQIADEEALLRKKGVKEP